MRPDQLISHPYQLPANVRANAEVVGQRSCYAVGEALLPAKVSDDTPPSKCIFYLSICSHPMFHVTQQTL